MLCAVSVAMVVAGTSTSFATSIRVGGLDLSTAGGCPAPAVDPDTRLGRIATANTYLRSLVTHDTSDLRVAKSVVRTEEGGVTANGAKELCKGNQGPVTIEDAVVSIREIRWVVDDRHSVTAFYLLDSPTSPTYIAERFLVRRGLIQHIEAIFYIDTTGYAVGPESAESRPEGVTGRVFASDDGPAEFFAPANNQGDVSEPRPADRESVRRAAAAYLHALVSHNARELPLAWNAVRIENRRVHGDSAASIRAAIASSGNGVTKVRDTRIWVEGDEALVMYRIVSSASEPVGPSSVVSGSSIWAATRVRVDRGRITEIESICSNSALCGTTR